MACWLARVGLALLVLLPGSLQAQTMALVARAGLDGFGAGVVTRITSTVHERIGVRYVHLSLTGVENLEGAAAHWNAAGSLLFLEALTDWYPTPGGFRLSGGVVDNGLGGAGRVRLARPVTIRSTTYTPDGVGDLTANLSFRSTLAPYAGVGWGNPFGSKLGLQVDLGAMYVGAAHVRLEDPTQISASARGADIQRDVPGVRIYPVLSVGLSALLF